MKIDSFRGDYKWLSNFYLTPIWYEGILYPSTEHAYQAAKTMSHAMKVHMAAIPKCKDVMHFGRTISASLRPDWEQVKLKVMADVLYEKFKDEELAAKLLATGDAELIEGNWWHDNYWGSCTCQECGNEGANYLGQLLMARRAIIKEAQRLDRNERTVDS